MKNIHSFLVFFVFIFILTSCGGVKNLDLDPDSQDFYKYARLIMTKQEKEIFNHLPDLESRQEFIEEFWEKRDSDHDNEVNEFKEEFYNRIDYANNRFSHGFKGWTSDRGRIYIYFGPPDKIERYPMLNNIEIKAMQIWIYYEYGLGIYFIDSRGDGSYKLDPSNGILGNFFDAMERAKMGLNYNDDDIENKLLDFNLEYNKKNGQTLLSIPTKNLIFSEEEGKLVYDFEFKFYVYPDKKPQEKKVINETRTFKISEKDLLDLKNIDFTFEFDIPPGKYYFDVVISSKQNKYRTRKIFTINI